MSERREWWLQPNMSGGVTACRSHKEGRIHVREVLPGDPKVICECGRIQYITIDVDDRPPGPDTSLAASIERVASITSHGMACPETAGETHACGICDRLRIIEAARKWDRRVTKISEILDGSEVSDE